MSAEDYRGAFDLLLSDDTASAAAAARWVDDPGRAAAISSKTAGAANRRKPQGLFHHELESRRIYVFRRRCSIIWRGSGALPEAV